MSGKYAKMGKEVRQCDGVEIKCCLRRRRRSRVDSVLNEQCVGKLEEGSCVLGGERDRQIYRRWLIRR